ncbi:MAG: pitrilysin family protein [Candidatus Pacearchaeota archaeon]|nr:pitrilysin family protein [Candidatus Pacearchaeota archaeon]
MDILQNFQKKKLSNGITVIHEKRDLPLVSLSITNPIGAAHETEEIKGIAHLIEHLIFTGTKKRSSEQISGEIEKKGGILNAFTSHNATSFWFKLPSKNIFDGLKILVDILKNPLFREDKFKKEKSVVLEEIKMYHDNPQIHLMRNLEGNLYEKPFGMGIGGTKESLSSLNRDFVFKYFKEKYSPENYVVTLIGLADFEKICEFLEKEFPKNKKPKTPQPKIIPIIKKNAENVEERAHIDQAHFAFGVHAPMPTEKEIFVLEVLDSYLSQGMSSKLVIEIREKRDLAYNITSSIDYEKNYSNYTIYVGTNTKAIPEVKKLILKGFKDIIKNFTPKDLKESKEMLIGLRKVSSEESIGVMNALAFSELIYNRAEKFYEYEQNINSVTIEEVKSLAKKLPLEYSTSAIIPKTD